MTRAEAAIALAEFVTENRRRLPIGGHAQRIQDYIDATVREMTHPLAGTATAQKLDPHTLHYVAAECEKASSGVGGRVFALGATRRAARLEGMAEAFALQATELRALAATVERGKRK